MSKLEDSINIIKNKNQQNKWNLVSHEWIAYQINVAIFYVAKMLIIKEFDSVKYLNFTYWDDVSTIKDAKEALYQCKYYIEDSPYSKEESNIIDPIIIPFYFQYLLDLERWKERNYVVVSSGKTRALWHLMDRIMLERDDENISERDFLTNILDKWKDSHKLLNKIYSELEILYKDIFKDQNISIEEGISISDELANPLPTFSKEHIIKFLKLISFEPLDNNQVIKHIKSFILAWKNTIFNYNWLKYAFSPSLKDWIGEILYWWLLNNIINYNYWQSINEQKILAGLIQDNIILLSND